MPDARSPEPLHLVQMIFDGPSLLRGARAHNLSSADRGSAGYLLHATLAACFGDLAPKPFRARERGRHFDVLGYSRSTADELRSHAQTYAEPVYWSGCSQIESKEMPSDWAAGRELGFEVRVCPVVRLASALETPPQRPGDEPFSVRKGAEVDVFLRENWRRGQNDPKLDRADVYERWLAKAMGPSVAIESATLEHFQLPYLTRRTQGTSRKSRRVQRPDATFRGRLKVEDAPDFQRLLARGVGRHRAFGFGMLLLRPPD